MESSPEKININFNTALFTKLPKEFISKHFRFLVKAFGPEYKSLFPTEVLYEPDLLHLMHLSQALEKLKNCEGYSEHINEFKNDIESTYLVTIIAEYLLPKSEKIILEPSSDEISKKADILAFIDGQEIYFECKNPRLGILNPIGEEHEEMYSILHENVTKPCDVSITYQNRMSRDRLIELGKFLRAKLPLVTGEGTILNFQDVRVEVTNVRNQFQSIGDIRMTRFWDNYHEKSLQPGSLINRNGIAMMFFKSGVNAFNNIENQIRNSKNKVPKDRPLIAVIHAEAIPGKLTENIQFVQSLFNENKYTSFNGVLFIRYWYTFKNLINHDFHFINNPFSRNPIPKLSQLFKSSPT